MRVKLLVLFFSISLISFSQDSVEPSISLETEESSLKINTDVDQVQAPTTIPDGTLGITDYLRVVFVLIFVIVLLYFVLKYIKKIGGERVGIDNDLIHVISTRALKGTTALHLIEVGNQVFLVGATDSSINRIAEITDQESKDMIKLNQSTDEVGSKTFVQFFTDKLKAFNSVSVQSEANNELKTQKDKLDRF